MKSLPKYFKVKYNINHPLWNKFDAWIKSNKQLSRCNSYKGYVDIIRNYKHEDIGNLPKCIELTLEELFNDFNLKLI